MKRWKTHAFAGGLKIIMREEREAFFSIGPTANDDERQRGRSDVARELCAWLNGGEEPWWIEFIRKTGPEAVLLPNGCEITATSTIFPGESGPTDRDDIMRGKLVQALTTRERDISETF